MFIRNSKKVIFSFFLFFAFSSISQAQKVTFKVDSVNFDFDKSLVKTEFKDKLVKYADYLKKNPSVKVRLEGHCDVRGTTNYNIALGQRRADAVKSYLVSLGVDASRLGSHSYGKGKTLCDDLTESCHSKNRRTEFLAPQYTKLAYYKNSFNLEVLHPINLKKDEGVVKTRVGFSFDHIFQENYMVTAGLYTDSKFDNTSNRSLGKFGLALVAGEKKNASAGINVISSFEGDTYFQISLGWKIFLTDRVTLNMNLNSATVKIFNSETSGLVSGGIGLGYSF